MQRIILVCLVACAPPVVSKKASKSSTIAMSEDEKLVAMANPDDDSVSLFTTADNARYAKVTVGDEPWAVVFAADGKTLYVANRAGATVSKITNADVAAAAVTGTVDVGSEPTGLALSPSGRFLYVAEWAEGRVAQIDTFTMEETLAVTGLRNPRALAVTNDGDNDDEDETVVVPEFYGTPSGTEAKNDSRTGRIALFSAKDLSAAGQITLGSIDTGFKNGGAAAAEDDVRGTGDATVASPNLLNAVAIQAGKVYVPSVSAAPQLPAKFNNNVYPVIYVGDLASKTEVRTGVGTTNLLVGITEDATRRSVTPSAPRLAMGDLQDIAFVGDRLIAYAVSRAADGVQRIDYSGSAVTLGSPQSFQIDVAAGAVASEGCKAPIGIVVDSKGTKAFLNCWVSRRLGVVDLSTQTFATAVESSPFPTAGSDQAKVQIGKRFYFTGRGRWSKGGEGWSACGSCHPDGLSDNITWVFGTGPRQTTSQDGSFSHGKNSAGKQRIFNWTGIFDEHHDFERNVRDVSGGLGVLTTPKEGKACGVAADEQPIDIATFGGLGKPLKEVNETTAGSCKLIDWEEVDDYVKTIRPPRGLRKVDPAKVARGAELFSGEGGCVKCHSGAGWTLSRRFYTPSGAKNTELAAAAFEKPAAWPAFWTFDSPGFQIQPQQATADPGQGDPAQMDRNVPPRAACVIRNVNSFGDDALEKKPPKPMTTELQRAQGKGGYNIPSLYGMSVGAPYLHNGTAPTLDALFSDQKFAGHATAAAANFAPSADDRAALIAFVLSIDADTEELAIPSGFDGCPQ